MLTSVFIFLMAWSLLNPLPELDRWEYFSRNRFISKIPFPLLLLCFSSLVDLEKDSSTRSIILRKYIVSFFDYIDDCVPITLITKLSMLEVMSGCWPHLVIKSTVEPKRCLILDVRKSSLEVDRRVPGNREVKKRKEGSAFREKQPKQDYYPRETKPGEEKQRERFCPQITAAQIGLTTQEKIKD